MCKLFPMAANLRAPFSPKCDKRPLEAGLGLQGLGLRNHAARIRRRTRDFVIRQLYHSAGERSQGIASNLEDSRCDLSQSAGWLARFPKASKAFQSLPKLSKGFQRFERRQNNSRQRKRLQLIPCSQRALHAATPWGHQRSQLDSRRV